MNYSTLVAISCLILTGCGTEITSSQTLPISAKTQISNQLIELEVAKTSKEKATGLMYRTFLSDNRGMLFEFKPAQQVSFWMKNCKIPLDMIFLKNGVVESISIKNPPCTKSPCPNYAPNKPIDQVIELRSNRVAELNVKVGDRIEIKFLQ
jgi:uncharacterized membrane protein (UPF0127 family)